jgi:acetyl esterase/lipase
MTQAVLKRGRWLLVVGVLAIPACRVTDLTLWDAAPAVKAGPFKVERIRDVSYCESPDADAHRHHLDLFLPGGRKDYPVVVLIHGGAWMLGDNRSCGLYSAVGAFLASQGIGAVLPNYRLSPGVKHPEHIKDVARAFAWTKRHIGEYGGAPDKLFVAGHSAGGHLAALLATDDRFLKAEGLTTADIKGVIAVSGVYRIRPDRMSATLGGSGPGAFRFDEILPLRGESSPTGPSNGFFAGVPMRLNVFGPAFGNDPKVRADASPVNHVRKGLPPFLIFCAERDLPTLSAMAEEFHQALVANGCDARLIQVKRRNHSAIMCNAIEPGDPVARAMLGFIQELEAELRRLRGDDRPAG